MTAQERDVARKTIRGSYFDISSPRSKHTRTQLYLWPHYLVNLSHTHNFGKMCVGVKSFFRLSVTPFP
jgi:hypothetical protein